MESVPTHVEAEALAEEEDLRHLMQYRELSARLAKQLANNAPRNRIIVGTYRRGPADGRDPHYGQTIVFAVDVGHAHVLARDFAAAGIPAGALTGSVSTMYRPAGGPGVTQDDLPRAELLERFRAGEFPVLVNVQVLTEGIDVPAVKTAFLARPTGSEVLMSQMVGRALRGEKVGGTSHAYLVSFRDHWQQFPDWMDPIRLPGLADVPAPAEPWSVRHPLESVDVEEWRRRLLAAAQEVQERIPASADAPWSAVPVGLFAFEVELAVENEWADEGELEARHVELYVYAHDEAGFDQLSSAVAAGDVGPDAQLWVERFFAETPAPQPAVSRLDLLARYVAAEGAMPEFIPLANREDVDPRRIARRLFDDDARRGQREAAITAATDANPTIVEVFYGGRDGLRRQVLEQLYRLEAGDPQSFDELRVPRVRGTDRLEHSFGEGAHDLHAILERVRTDPRLFPTPLAAPTGGIKWTKRPLGSIWADYQWPADSGGGGEPAMIRINRLLDSASVDEAVIEFLVYHELLHHQDVAMEKTEPTTGRVWSPHDRDFRHREAKHPATVQANARIDTFHDRLAAVDAQRRPVDVA